MNTIYVLGGRAKKGAVARAEWHRFQEGVLLELTPGLKEAHRTLTYKTPSELCPDQEPSITFKAGFRTDQLLYACTQTEVLVFDLFDLKVLRHISIPSFNDLHHVRPTPWDTLVVAVTGLDMVVELHGSGTVTREWDVLGGNPWTRFDRCVDYRKVPTTKPHLAHPNFVFILDQQVWVTRFAQRDAVCLTEASLPFQIGVEGPHDGIIHNGNIYFTTVDGRIVVFDCATRALQKTIDLQPYCPTGKSLGWCRGLRVIDDNRLIVGFSRLRPTRYSENLAWLKARTHQILRSGPVWGSSMPTRLWGIDLSAGKIFWELDLERLGMNAVFSIH